MAFANWTGAEKRPAAVPEPHAEAARGWRCRRDRAGRRRSRPPASASTRSRWWPGPRRRNRRRHRRTERSRPAPVRSSSPAMMKRSRRPSPLRSAGSARPCAPPATGVNDRREEAAAGVRQGDGNARGPNRHRHIRAVVAVEVAERGPSGHAGDDGFGGAEVRLPVVAAEYQVVPDDDGEILVAVAIDVHRGQAFPRTEARTRAPVSACRSRRS